MPPEYVLTTRSARLHEVELLQQLPGALARLRAGQLVQPAEHPQVLGAREVLVDRGVLAGQADDRAELLRLRDDVEAGHGGAAGVRLQQRGEDAHRRRLAGTVGSQEAQDAAFRDDQVDAVERADLALA